MEKRNVPKLRFKGFEDEWKELKFKDITSKVGSGKTPKGGNSVYTKEGIPFIRSQNVLNGQLILDDIVYISEEENEKMKSTKVKPHDVLLNITGASIGRSCIVPNNLNEANLNQHVCIIRTKDVDSKFVMEYIISDKIQKQIFSYQAGGNREGLNFEQIKGMKIYIPSLKEQEKIANFLSNVDKIIEEQEGQVKDLELYKKGMMQKIFKQEIRFKDDNGLDYPEWEEKKLGVLGSTYTGLSGKTKEDFGFGIGKYITYMNVFKNIRTDIGMIDLVDIKENENQNTVSKGDLLFTTSSETPQEVGMVSVCDNDIEGLYLNSFCFGFRFNELSNVNSYFMAYYLRSPEIRIKISILAQGSTRYNLSKTELMKIKLLIPCLAEQTKIANFLSNIDNIIEEENKKLEDLREWKKGLLQKMFV